MASREATPEYEASLLARSETLANLSSVFPDKTLDEITLVFDACGRDANTAAVHLQDGFDINRFGFPGSSDSPPYRPMSSVWGLPSNTNDFVDLTNDSDSLLGAEAGKSTTKDKAAKPIKGPEDEDVDSIVLDSDGDTEKNDGSPKDKKPVRGIKRERQQSISISDDDRPVKRINYTKRREDEKESSSEWVIREFSMSEGYGIQLDESLLPFRIPKSDLHKIHSLKESIRVWEEKATDEEVRQEGVLTVPLVSRKHFEMVLQWCVIGEVKLHPKLCEYAYNTIDELLELALVALTLEMPNLGKYLEKRIWKMISQERDCLRGHHINFAYTHLPANHIILKLFAQASTLMYMLHLNPRFPKEVGHRNDTEDMNNAQIAAAFGSQFMFQYCYDNYPEFKMRLLEEQNIALKTRREVYPRGRKAPPKVYYTDPLNGDDFQLCRCGK